MHRTQGDGYILDPIGGFPIYADEDPPTRDATQMRHEEANALQEEIVNVILSTGASLNASTESIQEMTQLNTAIEYKIDEAVASEAVLRQLADLALSNDIEDVDDRIDNLNSDDIGNDSTVAGASVTDALDKLDDDVEAVEADVATNTANIATNTSDISDNAIAISDLVSVVNDLDASDIGNDSSVSGSTVKDALNTLLGLFPTSELDWKTDIPTIMGGGSTVAAWNHLQNLYNTSTTPGWTDLNINDIVEVFRRDGSDWDNTDDGMQILTGVVQANNVIRFSIGNGANATWVYNSNHKVTVRVKRAL